MSSQSWSDCNYLFNAAAEPTLLTYLSKEQEGGLSETENVSDQV